MNKFKQINNSLKKWQLTDSKNYSGMETVWIENFSISRDCYSNPFMKLFEWEMPKYRIPQWILKT